MQIIKDFLPSLLCRNQGWGPGRVSPGQTHLKAQSLASNELYQQQVQRPGPATDCSLSLTEWFRAKEVTSLGYPLPGPAPLAALVLRRLSLAARDWVQRKKESEHLIKYILQLHGAELPHSSASRPALFWQPRCTFCKTNCDVVYN